MVTVSTGERRIRCGCLRTDGSNESCNRWLVTLTGLEMLIACSKCGRKHVEPLATVMQHLRVVLLVDVLAGDAGAVAVRAACDMILDWLDRENKTSIGT